MFAGVRLKIVPTVVFGALMIFAFGSAMPIPSGNILAQAGPMAVLAAIGIACGTFLGLLAHPAVMPCLMPFAAGLAYLFGGDLLAAAWTLLLVLPILALHAVTRRGMAATPGILCLAGVIALVCLPELYITLARALGVWAPGELLETLSTTLVDILLSVEIPSGDTTLGYTHVQAAEIAQLFVMLLPGLALFLCCAAAWIARSLLLLLFRLHGLADRIPEQLRHVTVSRMGAVVFLCAVVGSLLGGETLGVAEALSLNLLLLLEPPLVLVGLRALAEFARARAVSGMTLLLLILALMSCNLSILLLIVACIGVVRVFRRRDEASPSF